MKVIAFLMCLLFWALVALLFGCSSATGWRVSFGVSPVTAIEEQQKLVNKQAVSHVKY